MTIRGRLAFDSNGRLVEIDPNADDPTNPDSSEIQPVDMDELTANNITVSSQTDTGSLSTDSASVGGGEIFKRVDRRTPSTSTTEVQFSGLSSTSEYRVFYSSLILNASDVYMRANGDGSSTGDYAYWDSSATLQTGQNEFLLATVSNGAEISGAISVNNARFASDGRIGISHEIQPPFPSRISDFAREGGREPSAAEPLSSIELIADDGFTADETVIELWKRDY